MAIDGESQLSPHLTMRSALPQTNATGAAAGDVSLSTLANRAKTEPSRGARVLQRLGEMFRSIVHCFRPAHAEGGRLRGTNQRATRTFVQSLSDTCNTIKSAGATAQDIQTALLRAGHAANQLERKDDRAVLNSLRETLGSLSDQDLTRVAKALRGPEVTKAQQWLNAHYHPGAEKLLMHIAVAINDELIRRLRHPSVRLSARRSTASAKRRTSPSPTSARSTNASPINFTRPSTAPCRWQNSARSISPRRANSKWIAW